MTMNLTLSDRLRFWLIRRIAGKRTVILNATLQLAEPINVSETDPAASMIVDNVLVAGWREPDDNYDDRWAE